MHSANTPALAALLQVILIDIVLAGDNALVIGMVAARVPKVLRRRVIFWALVLAVIARVILAMVTATLLQVIGLMLAGGLLLLWVAWRLYREIRKSFDDANSLDAISHRDSADSAEDIAHFSIGKAIAQAALADLSMSLDNVLAVAGAALYQPWVLMVGLLLSIALMGLAAAMIANLLNRHPWISYAGLLIVLYVALRMIWIGGAEVYRAEHQAARSSNAVASSLVLNRGYLRPSESFASMSRSSSPNVFSPAVLAASINVSAV
ncbi:MAG TPA: YjbE family putative metal transport protein [Rhizomicrobium sp.]